jgi:hypothetical protein
VNTNGFTSKISIPCSIILYSFFCPAEKKRASDGYRRPVLTSETTKRKKLSNYLNKNNFKGYDQWIIR